MKKFIIILLTIAPFICAIAEDTLQVPSEYSSIQLAINASNDGDIVLVAPGIYLENINFKGKNILVTSHFILNDDLEYIKNTIIDGSNPANPDSASCVSFHSGEGPSAVIQGFTITGGTGTKWIDPNNPGYIWRGGGGVFTFTSSPTIKMNIIINNNVTNTSGVDGAQGGGTLSYNGNPLIMNNIIMQNEARYGAGIVIDYSGGVIKNNIIYKNTGGQDYGGGGFWSIGNGLSPIIIENNHIVENSVSGSGTYGGKGGAMFVWMGSIIARNNIVWGNTQTSGGPIAQVGGGTANVTYCNVEGGFTGEGNIDNNPEFSDSNFFLEQNSPCIDAGNPDPTYNDSEDPANPGFANWPSQGELRNDMGAYGGSGTELLPDVEYVFENLLNNPESVVFDSLNNRYLVSNWGNGNIIQIDSNGVQNYFNTYFDHIAGLHIVGNTLYAASNLTANSGLIGIDLFTADTVMVLKIPGMQLLNDITSDTSGNLYITEYYGNKIYKVRIIDQSYSIFVDIGLNSPNGILYNEENNRLLVMSEGGLNAPIIAVNIDDATTYTVVYTGLYLTDGLAEDNDGNIYVSSWSSNVVYRYDTTFSNPPEVFSSGHHGPADIFFNKLHNVLAVPNFNSNSVDFIPVSPSAVGTESNKILGFELFQNYPNPFNPTTRIKYEVPQLTNSSLKVYDILGNEIATLVNEEKPAGIYEVEFDASNLPSGVYFYKISSGSFIDAKKMLFIK